MSNPLTEVVKISGQMTEFTGTLLDECRVITNLHPILSEKAKTLRRTLEPGQKVIGEWFQLDFRPLPGQAKGDSKHGVVIAHGDLRSAGTSGAALEEWAILYDESCSFRTHGHVEIFEGSDPVPGEKYTAAGYSLVPGFSWPNQEPDLIIDTSCGIDEIAMAKLRRELGDLSNVVPYVLTDCAIDRGGSGTLLVDSLIVDGQYLLGLKTERPQLIAYGMFFGEGDYETSVLVPFRDSLMIKIGPHLSGDVDVSKYPKPEQIGPLRKVSPTASDTTQTAK